MDLRGSLPSVNTTLHFVNTKSEIQGENLHVGGDNSSNHTSGKELLIFCLQTTSTWYLNDASILWEK